MIRVETAGIASWVTLKDDDVAIVGLGSPLCGEAWCVQRTELWMSSSSSRLETGKRRSPGRAVRWRRDWFQGCDKIRCLFSTSFFFLSRSIFSLPLARGFRTSSSRVYKMPCFGQSLCVCSVSWRFTICSSLQPYSNPFSLFEPCASVALPLALLARKL